MISLFKSKSSKEFLLNSVCKGEVIKIEDVEDPVFAGKMVGDGFAQIPSEGVIYAPFDGEIVVFMDTMHAIVVKNEQGLEVLIHVGIDTVNLKGEHYEGVFKVGDKVKKGEVILRFDLEAIKAAGYQITTPVVIANTDNYNGMEVIKLGNVNELESVLKIKY